MGWRRLDASGRSPTARWLVVLSLSTIGAGVALAAEPPPSVAVLDFGLVDYGVQGKPPGQAEVRRLGEVSELVRKELEASGRFTVVSNEPARALIERAAQREALHHCNGCELDIARSLGADRVLVGWVQKVSNLILNMNVVLRDVATGKDVAAASVDLRGNTDESWSRAATFLVQRRLLGAEMRAPDRVPAHAPATAPRAR